VVTRQGDDVTEGSAVDDDAVMALGPTIDAQLLVHPTAPGALRPRHGVPRPAPADGETRAQLAFLADASRVLGASLEQDAILASLAHLAVPRLADWCIVSVVEGNGAVRRVVVSHADPDKAELALQVRQYLETAAHPGPDLGTPRVLRTQQAELHATVTLGNGLAHIDDECAVLLGQVGPRSALLVPIVARGRSLGAVTFVMAESGRTYDERDLALADDLAQRAALAVDNAQTHQRVAALARTLQLSLLPPRLPDIPGMELAARYVPAGEGIELAGDFYDVFPVQPDRWGLALGDVCGKGAEAARLTALVRYALRTAALHAPTPAAALALVNEALLTDEGDEEARLCTVAFAQLDLGNGAPMLSVTSGGHPLPLLVTAAGEVTTIGSPGTVLGVLDQVPAPVEHLTLAPGDAVVFYTDGLSEARHGDAWFGEERVAEVLAARPGRTAHELAGAIEQAVRAFQPGPLRDDLAVVVLRVSPRA
jgi:serine phosphatase RsbU (regulator of sigma subunit)